MEKNTPSTDELGRITYQSKNKTYRALCMHKYLGKRVRIITCLNNSETQTIVKNGRRFKKLITRVYSLTGKSLLGHSSRFVLRNVKPVYQESGYNKVIATHSKTPHAWLSGELTQVLSNEDYLEHRRLYELFSRDNLYLAYDPYKTKTFRYCNQSYLPDKVSTEQLPELISPANEIYCYESGILVAN